MITSNVSCLNLHDICDSTTTWHNLTSATETGSYGWCQCVGPIVDFEKDIKNIYNECVKWEKELGFNKQHKIINLNEVSKYLSDKETAIKDLNTIGNSCSQLYMDFRMQFSISDASPEAEQLFGKISDLNCSANKLKKWIEGKFNS